MTWGASLQIKTGTEANADNQNGSNKESSLLNFAIHFRHFAFKINQISTTEIWTNSTLY